MSETDEEDSWRMLVRVDMVVEDKCELLDPVVDVDLLERREAPSALSDVLQEEKERFVLCVDSRFVVVVNIPSVSGGHSIVFLG